MPQNTMLNKQNDKTVDYEFDIEPTAMDSEPTSHRPGSKGKVETMRLRFERGVWLHHPHDNQQVLPQAGRR
ncbi:MAG: hypothetical protein ACK5PB_23435 [Pirellula sp.]|jgi:hypothetical protein